MRIVPTHFLDPVSFARERLGFEPDEPQSALLRASAPRLILNCTRQWGKSTAVAIITVHHLCISPAESTAVIVSRSQRQSAEMLRKVSAFFRRAGIPVAGDGSNRFSLCLDNGSRVVALPGNEETIRCYSAPSLVVVDEAAMVPDAVYRAVRPMLAVSRDGRLILLSTPRGRHGFFHAEWTSTRSWHRVSVPATECPRIPPEFLEEERESLGDTAFRQEYQCEFADAKEQLFSHELLSSVLSKEHGAWNV